MERDRTSENNAGYPDGAGKHALFYSDIGVP